MFWVENFSYYELLGVTPSASPAEIDAAYAAMLDRVKESGADTNPAVSKLLSDAYATLSNPDMRSAYDAVRSANPTEDESLLEQLRRLLKEKGLEPDVVDLMVFQAEPLVLEALPRALSKIQRLSEARPFCVAFSARLLGNFLWSRHRRDRSAHRLLQVQLTCLNSLAVDLMEAARPKSSDLLPRSAYVSADRERLRDERQAVREERQAAREEGIRARRKRKSERERLGIEAVDATNPQGREGPSRAMASGAETSGPQAGQQFKGRTASFISLLVTRTVAVVAIGWTFLLLLILALEIASQ